MKTQWPLAPSPSVGENEVENFFHYSLTCALNFSSQWLFTASKLACDAIKKAKPANKKGKIAAVFFKFARFFTFTRTRHGNRFIVFPLCAAAPAAADVTHRAVFLSWIAEIFLSQRRRPTDRPTVLIDIPHATSCSQRAIPRAILFLKWRLMQKSRPATHQSSARVRSSSSRKFMRFVPGCNKKSGP